jgi:phosphoribosyl-dephospho-CoA transferase
MERHLSPHDLLRITLPTSGDALACGSEGGVPAPVDLPAQGEVLVRSDVLAGRDAPAWVEAALNRAAFVVVRRAPFTDGRIPIGVRGANRSERFGTWIDRQHIADVIRPEDLVACPGPAGHRRDLPAFALLRQIAPVCTATTLAWGPAGSTGFELASRVPTVTEASDLDLLIRMPTPMRETDAAALLDTLTHAAEALHIRIDVQAETPNGAISLAEYARPHRRIMLRHVDGPRLVADPWQDSQAIAGDPADGPDTVRAIP